MKNIVKTELWKATHNKMFFVSLIIGIAIALLDMVESIDTVQRLTEGNLWAKEAGYGTGGQDGSSLFIWWLPINGVNMGANIFYFVWPILAAIPYGWSYCQERKTGTCNQIVTRLNARAYFLAKYIAVFVSGGLAIMLPVLFSLLANALFCPALIPDLGFSSVFNGYFMSETYYTYPWIYSLCWCVMEFLLGGATAVLCFVVGSMLRYQFMTILTPFAFVIIYEILSVKLLEGPKYITSPLYMIMAAPGNANPAWLLLLAYGIMAGIGFILGYWQVVKREPI